MKGKTGLHISKVSGCVHVRDTRARESSESRLLEGRTNGS